MYLFVWRDGRTRHFRENLSALDYLAVAQGVLFIFRFDKESDSYMRLAFDNGKPCWAPVPEGETVVVPEAKLHH